MNRTTTDLIKELETEAVSAKLAGLIVGFPKETKFVNSTDDDQLKKLNQLLKDGGEPVGIYRFAETSDGAEMAVRLLAEHAGDAHLKKYLEELTGLIQLQFVSVSLKFPPKKKK